MTSNPWGGGGVFPYKGLMGTCGQPGYDFHDFVLNRVSNLSFCVLIIYQFLSQTGCLFLGDKQQNFYERLLINIRENFLNRVLKNRYSVLNKVGKSTIFVSSRVRV